MQRIKLVNDFHGTEAIVEAEDGVIPASSMNRARKKLCGIKNCTCGTFRGGPMLRHNPDGSAEVVECPDSSADVLEYMNRERE